MRANNEARSIRESVALCLHNMRTDYRILCDDCHDDERQRREECVARCLSSSRICDDCHDDERRRREECVARCLSSPRKSDDCHDDERREARRVRVSLFEQLADRRGGRKENPHDRSRTVYAAGA